MKRLFMLGMIALVGFDTAGQLGFKFTADSIGPVTPELAWFAALFSSPGFYMTVGAYVGAFFVYMALMRHAAVGPLFAASHLELVTITAISVVYFGERFNLTQALGCALIIGGIVILGFTEQAEDK